MGMRKGHLLFLLRRILCVHLTQTLSQTVFHQTRSSSRNFLKEPNNISASACECLWTWCSHVLLSYVASHMLSYWHSCLRKKNTLMIGELHCSITVMLFLFPKKITRKFNRGLRCVTEYAERCLPPGASGFLIPLNDSYSRRCSHLKTGIGKRLSSTKFSTGHFFLWIRAMVSVWSVVILCAGEVDPALLTPVAGIQTHSKPWQLLRILTIAGLNEA